MVIKMDNDTRDLFTALLYLHAPASPLLEALEELKAGQVLDAETGEITAPDVIELERLSQSPVDAD